MGRFDELLGEGSGGERRTMRVVRSLNKKFDRGVAKGRDAGRGERRAAVAGASAATAKLHARRAHRAPAGARGWYTHHEAASFSDLSGIAETAESDETETTIDEAKKKSHRGAVGWTKEKEAAARAVLKDYYSRSVGAGPVGHLKPGEKMVFGKVRKVESQFDSAAGLAEADDLSHHEKVVLSATRHYKSKHMGRDRREMMNLDHDYDMSAEEWEKHKASLQAKGHLNKAGAITPSGKSIVGATDISHHVRAAKAAKSGGGEQKGGEGGCPPGEHMTFGTCRKVGGQQESRFDSAAGLAEDHDPADGVKLRGLLEVVVKEITLCKEAAAKGDAADCAKRCASLDATLTQMTEIANRL